ncbi:MAG: Fimh-like protein [uncultured Sulfurovum sp.]|uniref:Fimh-like protein n=1 Tax=uncultured Sulfurovum sp. TaxID=269237 RepID=A0A6S6S9L7_9BACT|nr:MAG: Fimh-like protein [uncultured Sulfurovum sp.]
MNIKQFYRYVFVFLLSVFVFTGCGSDNGGGEFVAPDKVGYLIDSPIANIDYECGTKKAKTNSEGKFECSELPVTFKVGGIEVGILDSMTADSKVYPQDLAQVGRDNFTDDDVIKIAVFLQSLDDDGNIATEITLPNDINSTKIDTLAEMTLDEITTFLISIGKTAVSKEDAIKHLQEQFGFDVTKPIITLNGANPLQLTQGTAYSELGATATDDRDATVAVTTSGTVDVTKVGTNTITYKAVDSAGNEASLTRTVNVVLAPDTTKPVITLNGANPLQLTQGTAYSELGATATDDRDATVAVTTSGTVDVTKVGTNTITYKAVDSAGNEASLTRTVNVVRNITQQTILKTFTYDDTNRVVKEDLGDGSYIEYIYDDSGNLIQQNVVK